MTKPKLPKKSYEVQWFKEYTATGTVTIEATSKEEAYEIALDNLGDYQGSMQLTDEGIEFVAEEE